MWPVATSGCGSWTVTTSDKSRTEAFGTKDSVALRYGQQGKLTSGFRKKQERQKSGIKHKEQEDCTVFCILVSS